MLLFVGCGGDETPTAQTPNRAPEIRTVRLTPTEVRAGRSVQVEVEAYDPDGDALAYVYEPEAGAITGSGERVRWTPPEIAGNLAIDVRVEDGKGGRARERNGVYVLPPTRVVGQLTTAFTAPDAGAPWGASVGFYRNAADLLADRPAEPLVLATPFNIHTADFKIDLPGPGRYWLDAIKDANGDGCFGGGDLYGQYRDWVYVGDAYFEIVDGEILDIGLISMRLLTSPPCRDRAPEP